MTTTTTLRPDTLTTAATEEARELMERAIASFNARDFDAYFETLTDDVESFTGIVTPLRWTGLDAWKQFIAGTGELASATYEQREPAFRSYNDDAVLCNAYFVFTGVRADGEVERQTGRASHTLVRLGGSWRIANQHYSPMF